MTDIIFPLEACTINQLCGRDLEAQQCFRDTHPNIGGGNSVLAPYRPYLLSPLNKQTSQIYGHVRAMPARQHEVIAHTIDQHGEDTWPIVEFYNERLLPLQSRGTAHIRDNPTDAAGALVELPGHRASNFEGALMAYQNTLLQVRQAKLDRRPTREQTASAERARQAFKTLNERFKVELRRFQGTARARRSTALRDPERGIRQARSARSAKPITFSNTRQVMLLNRFAQGARIAGKGLLVIDAGIRMNKVHQTYQQGGDWVRTATVETVGMAIGFGAGMGTTYAVTATSLALAATPVGWVIVIAGGIALGYLAATAADDNAKELAGLIYDEVQGR